MSTNYRIIVSILIVSFLLFLTLSTSYAAEDNASAVVQSFNQSGAGGMVESFEELKFRHEIMFFMGAALLVFVFLTAGLGLSMALKGKDVFVAHMLSAGVTVFLAVAHSVVAIVWFFPFK
jgi:hypothetical protein